MSVWVCVIQDPVPKLLTISPPLTARLIPLASSQPVPINPSHKLTPGVCKIRTGKSVLIFGRPTHTRKGYPYRFLEGSAICTILWYGTSSIRCRTICRVLFVARYSLQWISFVHLNEKNFHTLLLISCFYPS